jgi:sortase A
LAERSLWALGLGLVGYWGWSQAAIRIEQARLEESLFSSTLPAGALDGAAPEAGAAAGYPRFEPGTPLALIEIPRLEVRAMVVEGIDPRSLGRAAGHLPGTALPGMDGNVVVAAHRDTLFAGLRDIEIGDRVTMKTGRASYTYRVDAVDVVAPTAVQVTEPTARPVLTLITCFPFDFIGPAPMRFVISALREGVDVEPTAARLSSSEAPAPGPERRTVRRPARRPLDPELLSFFSGALVKPGAS